MSDKKWILSIYLFAVLSINAQTTIIDSTTDGGFESGTTFAANNWSNTAGSAAQNQWVIDDGATSGFSGLRCAYVSNNSGANPPPHTYTNTTTRISHIYRDITIPVGESDITLNFDWILDGESIFDYMRVWIVPQSYTPTYGTQITAVGAAPTGNVQLGMDMSEQNTWTNTSYQLPTSYENTSVRLVFEWINDGSLGDNPPAAVDNISLISDINTSYCASTSTFTIDYIDDFSTTVGVGSDISNLNSGHTPPGYQDNTATQIVEQFESGSIDFTVDFSGTIDTFGFNIWVDWNNDLDFEDANENVYASGAFVTGLTDDFLVPAGQAPGDYTMRIRADYFDSDPDPCGTISYGETEDYTLRILAITCTDDPSNITISAVGADVATLSWTAPTPVPTTGYEYFVTTNSTPPSYSQVPTGTANNTTTTINLTGLSENTTYFVWVRSDCGGTDGVGNWVGPETFTTLATPPTTTNVTICPGDPSQDLTASAACSNFSAITQINGNLDIAGPYADTPPWFIVSTDPCAFDPSENKNYDTFDFQVDTDGIYVFEIDPTLAPDFMGYIVINDPLDPFTYGSCATGTWIAGDDDSGPGLDAAITATLIAGVNYTLVTTLAFSASQSTPYTWNVSGAGSISAGTAGSIEWYTNPTGGTPIATGNNFNPVGTPGSGVADTDIGGVYSFWAACSNSPNIRTQADFIIGKTWNGSVNADWENALNWTPNGTPTASDCLVIPNSSISPVINGAVDALGYSLTINSGGFLNQLSNSTLTLTNVLEIDISGTYTMEDSASLIQIDNVANTVDGTFTMVRTANMRQNDYVYWSSPVTSFNIENISPATPNGYKYEWLPTLFQGVGPPGNMVFGEWQGYNTGLLDVGKGYIIRGPNGHPNVPSPFTTNFNGTPNNGEIMQTIVRGAYIGPDYLYQPNVPGPFLTVTSDDDNWNLIGNPYPSAINAIDFLTLSANSNIDGFVYLWTHGTDINAGNPDPFYDDYVFNYNPADYLAYNASGTSIPTGFLGNIAAGQGFFVLMNDLATTTETVTFNNSMRDSSYANDQFYRTSETANNTTIETHRIWLDYIAPNDTTNTTLVAYISGATNGHDRMFDAKNSQGNGLNLYSLINEDMYIIQGRQMPFDDLDIVPLGLNISEAGIQTIAINTLEGLFLEDSSQIFIEDLYTGSIHNIKNTPYFFNSEAGIVNDRLVLRYNAESLGVNDTNISSSILVYKKQDEIQIESMLKPIANVHVYDVLGRSLFEKSKINQNIFRINTLKSKTQVIFLKISLIDGSQEVVKFIF